MLFLAPYKTSFRAKPLTYYIFVCMYIICFCVYVCLCVTTWLVIGWTDSDLVFFFCLKGNLFKHILENMLKHWKIQLLSSFLFFISELFLMPV